MLKDRVKRYRQRLSGNTALWNGQTFSELVTYIVIHIADGEYIHDPRSPYVYNRETRVVRVTYFPNGCLSRQISVEW